MSHDPNDAIAPGIETAHAASAFTARDVEEILRERGWLAAEPLDSHDENVDAPPSEWLERAATLLGPHAADRHALGDLLSLVFEYDAHAVLQTPDVQAVMTKAGAREVIRELARRVLDGAAIDSERFKAMIEELKSATRYRSRELFQPIRVALAGRAGEGELDRVILLLDSAAMLPFAIKVKGTRERMLEFCAALE
jgi:glutamyl/glutaminyl-tRNA synthetase